MARFAFITLIAAALLPAGIYGSAGDDQTRFAIMLPLIHTDKWTWEGCGEMRLSQRSRGRIPAYLTF